MENKILAGTWVAQCPLCLREHLEAGIRAKLDKNLTGCDVTKVHFHEQTCSSPSDFTGCKTMPSEPFLVFAANVEH